MGEVQEPLLRDLLGDLLRRVRREQGRTLSDVAEAARISMPYLSEVERGRKEASSEVLAAVCRALGVTVMELLERATVEYTVHEVTVHEVTARTAISSGPMMGTGVRTTSSGSVLMAA